MWNIDFANIIYVALQVLKWLIVVQCLLSIVGHNPNQPIIRFVDGITEPVMRPFRKLIPPVRGVDFSPIIVFFIIQLIQGYFR